MEKPEKYLKSPLHIVRCMGELTLMYLAEQLERLDNMMDDALDVDFGDE